LNFQYAKVNGLAPATLIEKRYAHINDFERLLVDHGTRILKVMLHISPEYQLEQFRDRLKTPSKYCCRKYAPWYVVPAEHKWFPPWW
jgi:polyphosphate kinase 2 (PPK2 family)